jgi:hypothetical protein
VLGKSKILNFSESAKKSAYIWPKIKRIFQDNVFLVINPSAALRLCGTGV